MCINLLNVMILFSHVFAFSLLSDLHQYIFCTQRQCECDDGDCGQDDNCARNNPASSTET